MKQNPTARALGIFALVAMVSPSFAAGPNELGMPRAKSAKEVLKEEDPELARYLELTSPGKEHEPLRRLVGIWSAKIKMWGGKGEQALEGEGQSINRMILGGRFLQQTFRGEVDGGSLVGFGLDGFDKVREKYNSVWVDNQNTAVRTFDGSAAADGKSLTLTSKQVSADSQKPLSVRSVTTLVDPKTYRIEQWAKEDGGEEWKSLEIEFTRQKEGQEEGTN